MKQWIKNLRLESNFFCTITYRYACNFGHILFPSQRWKDRKSRPWHSPKGSDDIYSIMLLGRFKFSRKIVSGIVSIEEKSISSRLRGGRQSREELAIKNMKDDTKKVPSNKLWQTLGMIFKVLKDF